MFNLLPQEEKSAIDREYRLRFTAVGLFFLASLCIVASISLIPSLFLSYQKDQAVVKRYKDLEREISLTTKDDLSNTLKLMSKKAAALVLATSTPYSYELVGDITTNKTAGIRIMGINIKRLQNGSRDVAIVGKAKDRETLLSFARMLEQKQQIFASVTVPVSNFASPVDINFSIIAKTK